MVKIQVRARDITGWPPAPDELKQWQDMEHMPDLPTEADAEQWLIDKKADELKAYGLEFQIVTIPEGEAVTEQNVTTRAVT
jgi:hypothetical protein